MTEIEKIIFDAMDSHSVEGGHGVFSKAEGRLVVSGLLPAEAAERCKELNARAVLAALSAHAGEAGEIAKKLREVDEGDLGDKYEWQWPTVLSDAEATAVAAAALHAAEARGKAAGVEEALRVPEVWSDEEKLGMSKAFIASSEKHGHYETMFAVAAWLLRHRAAAIRKGE